MLVFLVRRLEIGLMASGSTLKASLERRLTARTADKQASNYWTDYNPHLGLQ